MRTATVEIIALTLRQSNSENFHYKMKPVESRLFLDTFSLD